MASELQDWLNDVLRQHVHYRDSKVCVISIIGKSPSSGYWNKITPINDALGRQAFDHLACISRKKLEFGCEIEAYFEASMQAVFLYLIGPYDISLQDEPWPMEDEDFHTGWMKRDEVYAAHLLTLFLSSHIVLLVQPTCRLDTSYFRLFRALESMREKTQAAVSDVLAETNGVSKGWSSNGRLCAPRILFGFHRPPSFMKADGTVETKQVSYRKIERSMEDQIYSLFRKSRIITNNSANALMALPANQAFVYVFPPAEEPRDFIQELLNNFRMATAGKEQADATDKHGDDENTIGGGFKAFLMEHIELALLDGFNDNSGKMGAAFFELPKLKSLVRGLGALYDYFVTKYNENIELEELPDSLDITTRFSEGRCKKVLPVATSTYMDGLPQYYASTYHETKLAQALQVLRYQARGPCLERAQKQLIDECERHWRNGHQACETLSLTGNHCVNPVHRTSDSGISSDEMAGDSLPTLRHTSKIKFLSTCNCGRRQAWRDDPFSLREANYEFYEWRDEFECCRRRTLDRIDYPVYVGEKRARTVSYDGEEAEENSQRESQEKQNSSTEPDVDLDEKNGRGMKSAEKMFDRLKIATQSQEDHHDERGPSAGDDLLPDRDNRPTTGGHDSLADIEEFASANAVTFGDPDQKDVHAATKTQEEAKAIVSIVEKPPTSTSGKTSVFADLLRTLEAEIESESGGSRIEEPETVAVVGIDYDNESPVEELDEAEEDNRRPRRSRRGEERTSSRSAEPEEGENREWDDAEDGKPRKRHDRSRSKQPVDEGGREGVDYLSGMVHTSCVPGLLPLFSSWSLVCIGSSSLYSHSHGLRDQPNFTHGSSFLLPWDVQLQVDVERWQEQMECMAATSLKRIGPYKRPRQPKKGSNGAVTVKVFIGFEYECPRGHRFMLQAPDRVLKHPPSTGGGPKENGGILIKNDMPLWYPCSCRQAKAGFPGQLMRIHVVTPKAPVIVTVNPRLQPRPSTPGKPPVIFHPGAPGPAKLDPAQYWVLRLPFVYEGPEGPYYSPRDIIDSSGRVLRGMINIFPDLEH